MDSNSNDEVFQRWHFTLPEDYKRFADAGLLANNRYDGIRLPNFIWLSAAQMATIPWPTYKIKELVPFALTGGRDHFCWFRVAEGTPWIADCPRDSDFATGAAPSFEAYVYRALLEELTHIGLDRLEEISMEEAHSVLIDYAERAGRLMPGTWAKVLQDCAARNLTTAKVGEYEITQTVSAREVAAIIDRDLSFPMLNQSFRQHNP